MPNDRDIAILDLLQELLRTDATLDPVVESYTTLVDVVIDSRLDEYSKRFKSQAAYLTGLAGIVSNRLFHTR
jgi:hypothetical protein